MALIKISDVSVDKADNAALEAGYRYKDLFLDLETSVYYNQEYNKDSILKDVQGLFDIPSIKNSIANIFLTSPGQKILNPTFGIDLRRYLFDPVSEFIAHQIKIEVRNNLPIQEPRIQLENVSVLPNIDRQEYYITLQINVPSLDAYGLSVKSLLNSNGYYVL